jgi:broad specificity phosphatase PhoE
LVAEKLRDEHIDAAYSSDLTRALHTAQGIMRHHPHVELNVTTALREVDMGELEGKTKAEFHSAVKKSGKRWFELAPKGGESMIDTRARAAEFIERLFLEQKGKTVLLVSHGGFIRALLAHILKHDFRTDQPLRIINTAVTVVKRLKGRGAKRWLESGDGWRHDLAADDRVYGAYAGVIRKGRP